MIRYYGRVRDLQVGGPDWKPGVEVARTPRHLPPVERVEHHSLPASSPHC